MLESVLFVAVTVGVYGLGRFGYFFASLLAERYSVYAHNRSPRPAPAGVRMVGLDELGRCDAVFLCVAISAMEKVVSSFAPYIGKRTIVIDTCSVKLHPLSVLRRYLDGRPYFGTHPMFGPDSARGGVSGLPMIICPGSAPRREQEAWGTRFREFGLNVMEMTAEEHDREAAFTQGVTHFVGRVLADLELEPSDIATLGYQKLLAVMEQTCNDPYQLFLDLQRYNPYTSAMRAKLQKSLNRILGSLEANIDNRHPAD